MGIGRKEFLHRRNVRTHNYNLRLARKVWYSRQRKLRGSKVIPQAVQEDKQEQRLREELLEKHIAILRRKAEMLNFVNKEHILLIPSRVGLEGGRSAEKDFCTLGRLSIDNPARRITYDLSQASYLWPSTLALLGSLYNFRLLMKKLNPDLPVIPEIYSSDPKDRYVDAYLDHSGFHEYVRRKAIRKKQETNALGQKLIYAGPYSRKETVRFRHILTPQVENEDSNKLIELVLKYADFTPEQKETFNDKVFWEILLNVTGHGIPIVDAGWWLIGQYHKQHGIVSIAIADNGIGIKETLLAGPQQAQIRDDLGDAQTHAYILHALKPKVSGAWDARPRSGMFEKHEKLPVRGNGLKKIQEGCKFCGITLTIVSKNGYVKYDAGKKQPEVNSFKENIFAGTLYSLVIPAK